MSQSCPISFKLIDGTIVRINAAFITIFVVVFLLTSNGIILYFLLIDFITRLLGYKSFSLIYNLSSSIKKIFSMKTKMTDAGAKKLAAYFGLIFIFLMLILSTFNQDIALYVVAIILLCCSSLEVVFNYCVGCEIYHVFKKLNFERV